MAEPTETITKTVAAPELEPVEIGTCIGCDQPIHSGDGVTVDGAGQRWHPECRTVDLRKKAPKRTPGAGS